MDLNLSPDAYTGSQGNPGFNPSEPFWVLVPVQNGLSEWITFSQWVDRLAKPLPPSFHLMHMALGVAGEAGELVDAIKKRTIYEKPLDVENVKEELGDLLFYMQGIVNAVGLNWDDIVAHNRDKLLKRYPSGSYSNSQAQARADKAPFGGA